MATVAATFRDSTSRLREMVNRVVACLRHTARASPSVTPAAYPLRHAGNGLCLVFPS